MNSNRYSRLLFAAILAVIFININSCDKDNEPPPDPPPVDSLGVGWTKSQISGAAGFSDVFFVNNNVGWVSSTHIYKSTDGGVSWNKQAMAHDSGFSNMFFINDQLGWVVGRSLSRTKNGGATWEKLTVAGESQVYDVQFLNPRLGYLVGTNGLFRSTDSGSNWTKIVTNITPNYGFYFIV